MRVALEYLWQASLPNFLKCFQKFTKSNSNEHQPKWINISTKKPSSGPIVLETPFSNLRNLKFYLFLQSNIFTKFTLTNLNSHFSSTSWNSHLIFYFFLTIQCFHKICKSKFSLPYYFDSVWKMYSNEYKQAQFCSSTSWNSHLMLLFLTIQCFHKICITKSSLPYRPIWIHQETCI